MLTAMTDPHYFVFSRDFSGGQRLCGECRQNYDAGEHIEIATLKPYTNYVCPTGGGLGHSGIYTGALLPSNRTLRQHLCTCGAEYVEEDKETWQLSWEMQEPPDSPWRTVTATRTRHAAEQQRDGLLALADQGERIRNVQMVQLVPVSARESEAK